MHKYLLYIILFCGFSALAKEKPQHAHNNNVYNILPSTNVYLTMQDNLGYLWIGTTSGVYKYNGYSLTKFDYKDGLSNIDVWNLFLDSKDRIWLHTISTQLGYIKNDKYHDIYIPPNNTLPQIYPTQMQEYLGNVLFRNKTSSTAKESLVFVIKNDTLYPKYIPDMLKSRGQQSVKYISDSLVTEVHEKYAVIFNTKDWLNGNKTTLEKNARKITHPINIYGLYTFTTIDGIFAGHYAYVCKKGSDSLYFYNTLKNTVHRHTLQDKNEKIVHAYSNNDGMHIITDKNAYLIDSNLQLRQKHILDSVFTKNINILNCTYFLNTLFWGSCLSTSDGVYINYTHKSYYKKLDFKAKEYSYVGRCDDSTGCWWNENTKTLVTLCNGVQQKSYHLPYTTQVKAVSNVNGKLLLNSRYNTIWLFDHGRHTNLSLPIKKILFNGKIEIPNSGNPSFYDDIFAGMRAYTFTDSNVIYYTGSLDGTYKATFNDSLLTVDSVYFERYQNFCHNKKQDVIICYSSNNLMYINTTNNQKFVFKSAQLKTLGINGIENILLDDYGNIFVKDYDKLLVFNLKTGRTKRLFSNYLLEGAVIDLYKNRLNVAGVFGVIEVYVYGPQKMYVRNIYPNTKHIFYNHIKDVQFSKDNVLLNTDNGFYFIERAKKIGESTSNELFNCVVKLDSTQKLIHEGDTISFSQDKTFADLDIIKPTGTGILNIIYSINGREVINSGKQLIFPDLKAASYNTISLVAFDNNWKSKPIHFYIYIQPKWWQTKLAVRIIVILSIIFLGGIVYLSAVLTKRVVNRNNQRKNQRRELELKSIYSQINPHFIFNSLSTAQYFVKKNRNKEAYEHINQFSDLLRSYIKSSRDKYITIKEELGNLENYLQLQLTRFEDKFEYKFIIDPIINPGIIKIPSLLLQPLVENALNHGIFHSNKKGLLVISFNIDPQNNLICKVDDNGIGRQRSKELRSETIRKADSYGNILIKELIDAFNKYETIKIELEYVDKTFPETGTIVIIKIKNYTHV